MRSPSEKKINVLFPVETINRELDFRLVFAGMCASATTRIFVGQHDTIFRASKYAPGGIYLGKNIFLDLFPWETLERYKETKRRGITLVHLDEEGAIYSGGPKEWREILDTRLDPACLVADDYVCTWGDFQRDYFRGQRPACAANIRSTGHPRFDLCTATYRTYFEDAVGEIKKRFGRFVLFNSNLSAANNSLGLADTFQKRFGWDPADATKRRALLDVWNHATKICSGFIRLIHSLSIELPHLNFVIRPHPSEDPSIYRTIFEAIPNVHIVHEGAVMPWLLACELMLQDGCTTAVEAHLANTKIINYKSVSLLEQDVFLPNLFGTQCTTEAEAIDTVRAMTSGRAPSCAPVRNAQALSLLRNLEHTAFEPLLAVLREAEQSRSVSPAAWEERHFLRSDAAHGLANVSRRLARKFSPSRTKRHRALASAFYGFDKADIGRRLAKVESLLNRRLEYTFYGPELFAVELGG